MNARIPRLLGVVLATAVLASCASTEEESAVDRAVDATGDAVDSVSEATSDAVDDVTDSATWQRIEGNWNQFTGSVKERWGELTDDDMAELDGNKDQLVGKVQETYGIARAEAEDQVDDWAGDQ